MSPANECRRRGLVVGDTIQGREGGDGWWSESRLTLLWLGETVAVWREQSRSHLRADWSKPRETAAWTLAFRDWQKVPTPSPTQG